MKLEIGKKYTDEDWDKKNWVKIIDIASDRFWGITQDGAKDSWDIDDNWMPYDEPKPEVKINKYLGAVVRDKSSGNVLWLNQLSENGKSVRSKGEDVSWWHPEKDVEKYYVILKMPLWITDE